MYAPRHIVAYVNYIIDNLLLLRWRTAQHTYEVASDLFHKLCNCCTREGIAIVECGLYLIIMILFRCCHFRRNYQSLANWECLITEEDRPMGKGYYFSMIIGIIVQSSYTQISSQSGLEMSTCAVIYTKFKVC